MLRSTRSCRSLQVSRGIAGLRFSTWNQSSTSIDITAGGWSETSLLEESVTTLEQLPCVLPRRKGVVGGFRHVERARNSGAAGDLAEHANHETRARDLCLGHYAIDAVALMDG